MQNVGTLYTLRDFKPMYGNHLKSQKQKDSEEELFKFCDKRYPTRDSASVDYVNYAWSFFNKKDYNNAMKVFNQAWLLDSLNADVYWGFGNIQGIRSIHGTKYYLGFMEKEGQMGYVEESIYLLEKSIQLNPNNPIVWVSLASSLGNMFYLTKDTLVLDKNIEALQKANVLYKYNNPLVFGDITNTYLVLNKRDSVEKYFLKTFSLDSNYVRQEVKEYLKE
jgi:tetratricopeptide (TPR) repeat protein